jgi:hypothetical protein
VNHRSKSTRALAKICLVRTNATFARARVARRGVRATRAREGALSERFARANGSSRARRGGFWPRYGGDSAQPYPQSLVYA